MKIGLDAFSSIGQSGNSTYSRELIRHLLMQQGTAHRYQLFEYLHDIGRPMWSDTKTKNYAEVHTRLSPSYFPLPYLEEINNTLLRTRARTRGVELFHFTNPLATIAGHFKRVVTIHDLAALHDASWTKEWAGILFKQKLPDIISVDAIIAVSEFTKQDIIERLGVDPWKVHVVHEGVSEEFFPDNDADEVEKMTGRGSYLLCVGQLQPRKNNLALIQAFGSIAQQFQNLRLIFVGRPVSTEYLDTLKAATRAMRLADRVVFEQGADNALLRKLYTSAVCLVYPSLFEGFGLPVLESFQCGTPVITSNTSSLPEVAGEAGLFVDPFSVESIAEGMKRFLSDSSLREKLRSNIPAQLKKFSWEKAAVETIKVYESIK